jgi:predicted RNA-binding protein with RPS1 domain
VLPVLTGTGRSLGLALAEAIQTPTAETGTGRAQGLTPKKPFPTALADGPFIRHVPQAGVDASLAVGAVVEGTVSDVKEYGVLVNLAAHSELVGFAALHQARDGLKPGDKVSAVVLDVSKSEGIVDLSLRAQLLPEASSKSTKKRVRGFLGSRRAFRRWFGRREGLRWRTARGTVMMKPFCTIKF